MNQYAAGIMPYTYQQGNPQAMPPSAGKPLMEQESVCEQVKDFREEEMPEPEENEFLDYSFGVSIFENELILSWKRDILTV